MATPGAPLALAASRSPRSAFIFGIPLAAAILWCFYRGPLHDHPLRRYVAHPVECVEILMFCCAVCGLSAKWLTSLRERRALDQLRLPGPETQLIALAGAGAALAEMNKWPRRLAQSWAGRRAAEVLRFVCQRQNLQGLDDHVRALADNDAISLEGSYALTRFITWAIPILGFLGTVLGITGAISGVTPEVLEKSLSTVTDGLALAFDTTALGLALTMLTMFLSFLVERREQTILEMVDRWIDVRLVNRLDRGAMGADGATMALHRQTELLLGGMQQLVQRQIELWHEALIQVEQRQLQVGLRDHQQLIGSLETLVEKTARTHAERMADIEQRTIEQTGQALEKLSRQAAAVCDSGRGQQAALAKIMQALAGQAQNVSRIQEGEKELLRLQQILNQNLHALASTSAFQDAVHSLTAAIHLLTSRSNALQDSRSLDPVSKLRAAG